MAGDKIFIGPVTKGLEKFYLPFNIDNESFPTLYNFYMWRGRIKRKRGTIALDRFRRIVQFGSSHPWQYASFNLSGGAGNLLTAISAPTGSSIAPGTVAIIVGGQTYTDPAPQDGTLTGSGGGSGTINYATGAITISGGGVSAVTGGFTYFPALPGMGLEDYVQPAPASSQYPVLLGFDTKYAYQISSTTSLFYSVSYYKYTNNPVVWTGADYQQFWSTNYLGAFWVTNGKPGFRYAVVHTVADQSSSTITMVLYDQTDAFALTTLILNDYLFFNEGTTSTTWTLNGQTGYISQVYNQIATPGKYDIKFPTAQTSTGYTGDSARAQLLTSSVTGSGDGIRWYDGDMTSMTGLPTSTTTGWVNFSPPLYTGTPSGIIIGDLPPAIYYLVGCTAIVPFKDRLLFFGVWVQKSDGSSAIFLQDTVVWSWNGTAYYALAPVNQSADPTAYFINVTGKGGYLTAGIEQQIVTMDNNEDVLLVGFSGRKTRFVYSGNDLDPFAFYNINVEYGSAATFSSVTLDRGALTFGVYGFSITSQTSSERFDLSIPDEVFSLKGTTGAFAAQRISSARDFYHEWAYFTFVPNSSQWNFPTQTFQYNYRENSWSVNYENFTTHGLYRPSKGYTWATIPFASWGTWSEAWNASSSTALFPNVVAATPQGFVVQKGLGVGEAPTGSIYAISQNGTNTQITSYNHCVEVGDYLFFQSALGTQTATITNISNALQGVVTASNSYVAGQYVLISEVTGMTQINGLVVLIVSATSASFVINLNTSGFSAYASGGLATVSPLATQIGRVDVIVDANNFTVDIPYLATGYIGLGTFTRLIQPLLQTKQFPVYWQEGRKVRLGVQKYLFDTTVSGQATISIYLSQDPDDAWNAGAIVPSDQTKNSALIYSDVIATNPNNPTLQLYNTSLGAIGNGILTTITLDLYSLLGIPSNTQTMPLSVLISIGTVASFQDNGVGGFKVTGTGLSYGSAIDYMSGFTTLAFSSAPNAILSTISLQYFYNNIQNPISKSQQQTWQRMNTSLIGDTFQIGITLSDAQMRSLSLATSEISVHAMQFDVSKGPYLS